jgi:hypothetical protein
MPPTFLFQEKIGSASATGIGKETTFGTAVTPDSFIPFTGNTMNSDPGFFMPDTMVGTRDVGVFPVYGQEKDVGAIDGPLFPTNGIELLVYAIGTDSEVSGSGGLFTHTVTQAVNLASMTIEKNIGSTQSLQFAGARVGKYSIKAAATDTTADFTCDLTAQSYAILDSPSAISIVNEEPFVFAEYVLVWNGQTLRQSSNFTLDIDNGIKATYTMNGFHEAQFVTPTILRVAGTFDVVWDSLDDATYGYFSQMQSQVDAALSLQLYHPSSGGAITLTMPHVRLTRDVIDPKVAEVVMETISWTAHRYIGVPSTIGAQILNTRSAPY